MEKLYIKSIFLLFLLTISLQGFAQEISIKNRTEHIIVKDSSFVRQVDVTIAKSDRIIIYPIFYDSELEEVTDIQVALKKGKRFKAIKDSFVKEEDVELEYIASKKVKSVVLYPGYETKVSYKVRCSELMYFSDLRFFSDRSIDTLNYRIQVPNKFHFVHNTIHKDSLSHFVIDSIPKDGLTQWNIEVVPYKIAPDPLAFFGVYRNKRAPLMRTLIVPTPYKDNELKYMNDWYLKKVTTKRGLSSKIKMKIDELTEGMENPRQVVETLYDYVKNNFKYVAIEIGMGAFIPTHANDVFSNKEGDCKDLSNFLSEALNYKGIQSNIALTATYDHISDCNFPSLSSANHVVCLAYLEDNPIVLDPTDPIHIPETPVQSIQNRSLLIVNPEGGAWHKAERFTAQQNIIDYEIALKANSDQMLMQGQFKAEYHGISGNFLRRRYKYSSTDKKRTIGKKHYEFVFGNQSISACQVIPNTKTIKAQGELSVNGKVFSDSDNKFLFIDFLPRLLETVDRDNDVLEGTHLGSNFKKKVALTIEMEERFEPFEAIEHVFIKEGVSLNMKITSANDRFITCNYELIFDYDRIEKENRTSTNEILKSFKKVVNEPILLKKKG